jgi:hypothetical protein
MKANNSKKGEYVPRSNYHLAANYGNISKEEKKQQLFCCCWISRDLSLAVFSAHEYSALKTKQLDWLTFKK